MQLPINGVGKANTLQSTIQFSQASLQDFVDCRRRFQLRYLYRLAWPSLEAEPALENERAMQQGALFHHMIRQHLSGVPAERLKAMVKGEDLSRWWGNYMACVPELISLGDNRILRTSGQVQDGFIYPEVMLASTVSQHRLVAVYDLIRVYPKQRALIIDWKTSRKRTGRAWLSERLQTRVYPYLLVKAGTHLNQYQPGIGQPKNGQPNIGQPFSPEQVEMIYWFAEYPAERSMLQRFTYDTSRYYEDEKYLVALINEIATLGEADFPLTPHIERCKFCTYRSLCERGIRAGAFDEVEETGMSGEVEPDFDYEQISEIAV